jgi:hypothetical protein
MPEPKNKDGIESSGQQSVSLGGNNEGVIITGNIYQYLGQSPPTLSQYIRIKEFESLVNARTSEFIGRGYIFDSIHKRLINSQDFPSGYILIEGEPGIGKTSLFAQLVKEKGYIHHFNISSQNIRTARDFLGNVCAQLIAAYQLNYTTLPDNATRDSGFLSQLLLEAVAKSNGNPVVVLIDALDEAEDDGLPSEANRLFLPQVLPAGVFFLVSTRPQYEYRLQIDSREVISIDRDSPQNKEDITLYIEKFIQGHSDKMQSAISLWGLTSEEFVYTLMDKSEGNFMYLVHVLKDIAAGHISPQNIDNINKLPQGLKSYYQRHWRTMRAFDEARFGNYYQPVVCILAAAREPVTIKQIVEWTKNNWPQLNEFEILQVIRMWREFLNEDNSLTPITYRIYHSSFQDFLKEEVGLKLYDEAIAMNALNKIPGFFR